MKYLMLDDDSQADSPAELYAEALERASEGHLSVSVRKPHDLSSTLFLIGSEAPEGLLLDVALTNAQTVEGEPIGYDGIALAQQIRTLQTRARSPHLDSGLHEFPIIRLSKRGVIREYVSADSTSDDLFDAMIYKEEVVRAASLVAKIAVALAEDYPRVVGLSDRASDDEVGIEIIDTAVAELLSAGQELLARLDPRTLLGLKRPGAPAHVLAKFLTSKLLEKPGPLIDEELVAIRLGVDSGRSGDWPALLAGLEVARYSGAFSGGYKRWWAISILDWWRREIDTGKPPSRLAAESRVDLLRQHLRLNSLEPIAPLEDSPGLRFWHRCRKSGQPVDPSEGFPLLPAYSLEGWHDVEYLCREEALRDRSNPRLAPAERARIAAILESIAQR